MAIIKTVSEIRSLMPRLFSSLSDSALLPNMDLGAWKHLVPLVGQAQYDAIDALYNANPQVMTDQEQMLLLHMQLVLAPLAVLDDMAFIHATITDNGIRTASTATMTAAHKWEFVEMKSTLLTRGKDATERLLEYLDVSVKAGWFPLYADSVPYQAHQHLLIRSSADFSKQFTLQQPQQTYFAMVPMMGDVEENYLVSTFGRDLLAWIKTKQHIEIIDGTTVVVDIMVLIKKAVAYLTIKHTCDHMTVNFTPAGFSLLAGDQDSGTADRQQAGMNSITQKREAAARDGQNYLSRAAWYMGDLGAGTYALSIPDPLFDPAFLTSPLYVDPSKPVVIRNNGNYRRRGVFVIG